jgi:oxygen-dependent protoporphyrinogen oxidase
MEKGDGARARAGPVRARSLWRAAARRATLRAVMGTHDVVVIGAGISGLTLAFEAAGAGRKVLVLEAEPRLGGCLATHRTASGYWLELGAHTCYNSYYGFTELVDACGLRAAVLQRAKTHMRMLEGDALVPGSNMGMLLRLFSWGELLQAAPQVIRAMTGNLPKEGETVYSYYARLVGRKNYGQVLGPMLSAVPSQSADAFPASMLFKTRSTRRKEFPRSFTLQGGLQTFAEALASRPGVTALTGQPVAAVERTGEGFAVVTQAGERHLAPVVAVATTPGAAARLLRPAHPELAGQVARVKEAVVESLGFAVPAGKVAGLPVSTFIVPRDDVFYSVVTRDPVPDPAWRGFAFHFKPGLAREAKLARAARLLGLAASDLEDVTERRAALPSPVLGHEEVVREIDRLSAGRRLCVTGNWFAGLSLEDCVERSRAEWRRVAALG